MIQHYHIEDNLICLGSNARSGARHESTPGSLTAASLPPQSLE